MGGERQEIEIREERRKLPLDNYNWQQLVDLCRNTRFQSGIETDKRGKSYFREMVFVFTLQGGELLDGVSIKQGNLAQVILLLESMREQGKVESGDVFRPLELMLGDSANAIKVLDRIKEIFDASGTRSSSSKAVDDRTGEFQPPKAKAEKNMQIVIGSKVIVIGLKNKTWKVLSINPGNGNYVLEEVNNPISTMTAKRSDLSLSE